MGIGENICLETGQQTITFDKMLFSRRCCKKCLKISEGLS